MIDTQVLKCNLIRQDYTTAFMLNQGDKGVPFKIELIDNGTPYTLLKDDIVTIEWLKPNGSAYLQEGNIKYGTNYIEFTTPEAIAQYSGSGSFNIIITNNNARKGTIRREYKVVPTSMKPGSVSEDTVTDAITELRSLSAEIASTVQNNQDLINNNTAATKSDIAYINSDLEEKANLIGDDGTLKSNNRSLFISIVDKGANLMDFGAKGDGVTDDSAIFNMVAQRTSKIFIPPRPFVLTNIQINKPLTIEGCTSSYAWRTQDGDNSVLINNGTTDMFINKHWNDGGNSLEFKNIVFKGNGSNNGIKARWDLMINNCTFNNFNKGIYDLHGGNIVYSKFDQNKYGISGLTDTKVALNDICRNEIGIDMSDSNSNNILGNRIEWNTVAGINHTIGVYNTINDNQFDRNQVGIIFDGSMGMNVCNNRFDRNIEYHMIWKLSGGIFNGNKFTARDITDDSSGDIKPLKSIKLVSYEDILFYGNDSNTKIFDNSSIEHGGGYFLFEGNRSPNLFKGKTFTETTSGEKYYTIESIAGDFTYCNGWGYEFEVKIEYGDFVIYPYYKVSKYQGINVTIPDMGASEYKVIIQPKKVLEYRVL